MNDPENGRPLDADHLGLDELMIVNPDSGGPQAVFLRGDGELYGVEEVEPGGTANGGSQFFLGEDGSLYQVAGDATGALSGDGPVPSQFFLGDDGTLYRLTLEPRG